MAITRERKEELLTEYARILSGTDGFIVTEYRGLSVAKLNDLRDKLRSPAGGSYSITKNTLFRIALERSGWVVPAAMLEGPTAVVFGNGNLPAVAKVVQDWQKTNAELFIVKGGVLGASVFQGKELGAVANLPTMDEIRAQLAGLIVAPASQLAGLLQAATSQVVNVLQALEDKHNKPEEAETAA